MTDPSSRLGEIKARLSHITPGPWEVARGSDWDDENRPARYVRFSPISDSTVMARDEDAEFIAAAPVDVGWLLEHVEQLQAEVAACRDADDFDPNPLIHVYDDMRTERDMALRMHQVQFERANRLQARRRVVLDLCDSASHTDVVHGLIATLVPVAAVRAALGADDDH